MKRRRNEAKIEKEIGEIKYRNKTKKQSDINRKTESYSGIDRKIDRDRKTERQTDRQ